MSIMSTVGVQPTGGCHYPLAGWSEFARLIQPLIERDNYGLSPSSIITPPNLVQARFATPAHDAIELEFDQPVEWDDSACGLLYLDENDQNVGLIRSGKASGHIIRLQLGEASKAETITYLCGKLWDKKQDHLIYGTNRIAALTFCNVPIRR